MDNPLLTLASHAISWRDRPLPAELAHHARRALVDWFAALIAGAVKPPATLLASALAPTKTGAIAYVDGRTRQPRDAALLNAMASHTVEFDDIHRDSGYHPAAPSISAALAIAQSRDASMDTLLRAIIAGYEVSCRIGMAVQPSHYRMWHTTGTVGTFGAAVAAALLLDGKDDAMAHSIALAATMAAGLQQAFRGDGMSKPLHAGHAAEAGVLAALAAANGVTGALDVLHGPVGFAAATSADQGQWAQAFIGLDRDFAIQSITFKNHGCCGHIFAALDAVAALKAKHGFAADDVAAIEVRGYRATKEVCDRAHVQTAQEARFSAQYCVAALLHLGGVRLAAFSEENLCNPAIRATMARVSVGIDADLADAYPKRRPARVIVRLLDGRVLTHFQPGRKGDPEEPLSDADLSAKFLELACPVIGENSAQTLLQQLWSGEAIPGAIPASALQFGISRSQQ